MITENRNAIWMFIDGSQESMDKIFVLFQSIEASSGPTPLIGLKREKPTENGEAQGQIGKMLGFKVYYERFANPRQLIAIPKS